MSTPPGLRPFNHEYWRDTTRQDWRERGLHWHCFSWRGDGAAYRDDAARRDPSTELPPLVVLEWLGKPARCLRLAVLTPDEAVGWLHQNWQPAIGRAGEGVEKSSAEMQLDEIRYGRAHYDLRVGNNVTWGIWVNPSTFFHVSVVGTSAACHKAAGRD